MRSTVLPLALASARLRRKNQLTVPEWAVGAVGAKVGDRFLVLVLGDEVRLKLVRDSYAGSMTGVFPDDAADQIRAEREAWGR